MAAVKVGGSVEGSRIERVLKTGTAAGLRRRAIVESVAEGIVEVEAPAVGDRAADHDGSRVVVGVAGVGVGIEAGVLQREEGIATGPHDAGSVGEANTIHIVHGIEPASGVGVVDVVEEVGAGAAGNVVVLSAGEHVLVEGLVGNQARVCFHLGRSDAGVVQVREDGPSLLEGLS